MTPYGLFAIGVAGVLYPAFSAVLGYWRPYLGVLMVAGLCVALVAVAAAMAGQIQSGFIALGNRY